MRIDRTHRSWLIASVVLLVAAWGAYVVYDAITPGRPQGDSWFGLAYGLVGTLFMAFAALLGARKRALLLRVGRLAWWMKGHLWLGLLSLPIILLHGAFQFGGTLTTVMMVLLIAVVLSGIAGAVLQHALPKVMTAEVTEETTYEALERQFAELRDEAFTLVAGLVGPVPEAQLEAKEVEHYTGRELKPARATIKVDPKADAEARAKAEQEELLLIRGQAALSAYYLECVMPYLRAPWGRRHVLANAVRSSILFDSKRPDLHPQLHEALDELERICDEARQKVQQIRLHRVLHAWLLVHIPLSTALLALVPVHIIASLYY